MSRIEKLLRKELPPKRGEKLVTQADSIKVTHLDDVALEIINAAKMSTYNRQGYHRGVRTSNIINDFFQREHFEGKIILELGPGHYSFALLARELGASVICVERDPVHSELGRYLGFEVLELDFEFLAYARLGRQFDGLWLKNASNACNYKDKSRIGALVHNLDELIAPDGWGWMVPRNKANYQEGTEKERHENACIAMQKAAFLEHGWTALPVEEGDRKRYALKFAGARYYYLKNIQPAI